MKYGNRKTEIDEIARRFWSKVDIQAEHECWPWIARARSGSGYGLFLCDLDGRKRLHGAHRVAFWLSKERPPAEGLHVLHACDNKLCCNPRHLSEGTPSQNMREAWSRGRVSIQDWQPNVATKLTEDLVRSIRARAAAGEKRKSLAAEFGMSKSGMDHVIARRVWEHV